jgi:hypothetical protein
MSRILCSRLCGFIILRLNRRSVTMIKRNEELTNQWIEKIAKEEGLKVGYVELKGYGK